MRGGATSAHRCLRPAWLRRVALMWKILRRTIQ